MNKKNILLVNSVGEISPKNKFYLGGVPIQALSLEYLAASLEAEGYPTEILSGTVPEEELLSTIDKLHPLAIGFSIYTYSYKRALSLAQSAKKKARSIGYNLFTIFGGYHVSCLPKETIANDQVDFVIQGEGDTILCKLMQAITHNQNYDDVKGIFFKKDQIVIQTPPAKRITNLDTLPLPKRSEKYLHMGQKDRNLGYPSSSDPGNSALINYSRGCPFACSFCTSRNTWGNQVFWRDPRLVVNEIEMLYTKHAVNKFAFLDLTFNSNRQKTMELCHELIKRDIPTYWGCMARLDLFDKELLETMAKAKCIKIGSGLESPIDLLANSIKDKYSIEAQNQKDILQTIDDLGILHRAFLIIGFPNETKEILEQYTQTIESLVVDELRVTIATPFPGTSFWNECVKKNLLPDPIPWEKFTTAEPVILHPHLSDENIYHYREKLITTFFFSNNYKKHLTKKFQKFPHYRRVWKEYFEYLVRVGAFKKYKKKLNDLVYCINNN